MHTHVIFGLKNFIALSALFKTFIVYHIHCNCSQMLFHIKYKYMHPHVIFGLKLFIALSALFKTFITFTAIVRKYFSTLSTSTCTHMSYLVLSFLLHSVHCSVTSSHSLQMFGNAFPHYYIKRIFFTLITQIQFFSIFPQLTTS